MKKKKIGIMGGTFNPIHCGHLLLGEAAREQFGLDKVLYIPLKRPPHKETKEMALDVHRVNMIKMAILDNLYFELSTIELERSGITYTVDTVSYLTEKYPENEYYFILGADSLLQLEAWKNPEEILKRVQILAASRGEVLSLEMKKQMTYLIEKYHAKIDMIQFSKIDISSSMIRKKCREKKSIKYLVPEVVEHYIEKYQLYIEQEMPDHCHAENEKFIYKLKIKDGEYKRG